MHAESASSLWIMSVPHVLIKNVGDKHDRRILPYMAFPEPSTIISRKHFFVR